MWKVDGCRHRPCAVWAATDLHTRGAHLPGSASLKKHRGNCDIVQATLEDDPLLNGLSKKNNKHPDLEYQPKMTPKFTNLGAWARCWMEIGKPNIMGYITHAVDECQSWQPRAQQP